MGEGATGGGDAGPEARGGADGPATAHDGASPALIRRDAVAERFALVLVEQRTRTVDGLGGDIEEQPVARVLEHVAPVVAVAPQLGVFPRQPDGQDQREAERVGVGADDGPQHTAHDPNADLREPLAELHDRRRGPPRLIRGRCDAGGSGRRGGGWRRGRDRHRWRSTRSRPRRRNRCRPQFSLIERTHQRPGIREPVGRLLLQQAHDDAPRARAGDPAPGP